MKNVFIAICVIACVCCFCFSDDSIAAPFIGLVFIVLAGTAEVWWKWLCVTNPKKCDSYDIEHRD